jgi:DNA-binding transcriptional regulator PaaX
MKQKKINFGEITYTILEVIARTPEAIAGAFLDYNALSEHLAQNKEFLSDQLLRHLRNLKRSGYIDIEKNNNLTSVKLTIKGKIKHLENSSDNQKDGKIRIISFDIPETQANKRKQFCRSIRRIGFRKLQKSLWICLFIKADEIDLIIDELGIRQYVAYFVATESNIPEHINKLFTK